MNKDLYHQILRYLHDNYSPEKVEINDFLYAISLSKTNLSDANRVKIVINRLKEKNYITYTDYACSEDASIRDRVCALGEDFSQTNPERIPGSLENRSVKASLTMDGYNYISTQMREDRIERQINVQTKLTKTSMRLVLATVIISAISLAKEIWQPPPPIYKDIHTTMQSQDSSLKNLDSSLHRIDSTFRNISDSLRRKT